MTTANHPLQHPFHSFYADHHGWLVHWLCRRLGCAHGAADLAHEDQGKTVLKGQFGDTEGMPAISATLPAACCLPCRPDKEPIEHGPR